MIFGNCRGKMGDVVFERQSEQEMQRTYYAKHRRNDSLATLESRAKLAICSKAWNFFSRIGVTTLTQRQFCKANYYSVPAIPRYVYEYDPLGLTTHYWQLFTPTRYDSVGGMHCTADYTGYYNNDYLVYFVKSASLPFSVVKSWERLKNPSSQYGIKHVFASDLLKYAIFNILGRDVLDIFYYAVYVAKPRPFQEIYPPSVVKAASSAHYVLKLADVFKLWDEDYELITFRDSYFDLLDFSHSYDEEASISIVNRPEGGTRRFWLEIKYYPPYEEEEEEYEAEFVITFRANFPEPISALDFAPKSDRNLYSLGILKNYGVFESVYGFRQLVSQIPFALKNNPNLKDEWIQTWAKPFEKSPEL